MLETTLILIAVWLVWRLFIRPPIESAIYSAKSDYHDYCHRCGEASERSKQDGSEWKDDSGRII